jgi:zinc transporter, ZIP family
VKRVLVLVAVVLVALAAAAEIVVWRTSGDDDGEASISTASLRPGEIDLLVSNDSSETTRLAQVILNDSYVDFRASTSTVRPGQTARLTIWYPWIAGESYDVEVLTSTGASIDYEIEDVEAA